MPHSASNPTQTAPSAVSEAITKALTISPAEKILGRGFVAIRAGLFDHLTDGRMSLSMLGVFLIILRQADWSTGIWLGSSKKLEAALGYKTDLDTLKYVLRRLCRSGYLKSFHKKGRRGNYRIIINKFRPTLGHLRGKQLNADLSTSLENLVYENLSDIQLGLHCDSTVTQLRLNCDSTVVNRIQDIQDVQGSQEVQAGKPSSQPTCDGKDGRLGSPTSSDKDNTTANVKLFAGWMSDLIQKRTGERSVPNQREMNLLMRSIGDARPIDVIVGFYKFLARPKGVGGLGAPFAMFAQEWPYLERDAKEAVEECGSVAELVKELDEDINWGFYGDSDTQIERTQQLASQLNLSASGQLAAQN